MPDSYLHKQNCCQTLVNGNAFLNVFCMLFVFLLREDSFLGATEKIGHKDNGRFRGILELLAVYDPILHDHLNKIKQSEKANKRMQAHYLSPQTQNEFILVCSESVLYTILQQIKELDITVSYWM